MLVDASVVGRVFWRGALAEMAAARRPRGAPRLTRGARPDRARGGVADPGRPAVRVQARADPGRRVPDASRAPRGGSGMPRSRASLETTAESASRTRRSATTGARRASPSSAVEELARRRRPGGARLGEGARAEALRARRSSSCRRMTTSAAAGSGCARRSRRRRIYHIAARWPRQREPRVARRARRAERRSAGSRPASRRLRSRRSARCSGRRAGPTCSRTISSLGAA